MLIRNFLLAGFAALPCSCATVLAEVQLADGNILVVEGVGVKSSVQLSCLRKDAIEQIVLTQIPPTEKPGCKQVVIVSASSSEVSKAIAAFVSADIEFSKTVSGDKSTTASKSEQDSSLAVARGIVLSSAVASDADYASEVDGMLAQVEDSKLLLPSLREAKNNAPNQAMADRLATTIKKITKE